MKMIRAVAGYGGLCVDINMIVGLWNKRVAPR